LPIVDKKPLHILDFDIETVAAGFADPQWVPQKITCVAWSWIGFDKVESRICTPLGLFGQPERRKEMLSELLTQIRQADMLTGHNIARFDLPVINSECMRFGLEPIASALVQDTMRVYRATGFKKGQDNILTLMKAKQQKMALNWQEWQDAYDEDGWTDIRRRCESDVTGHKELRQWLLDQRYLRTPQNWIGWR
jgi:DNA polymerase elongation subunit (family B)